MQSFSVFNDCVAAVGTCPSYPSKKPVFCFSYYRAMDVDKLYQELKVWGQEHLLQFWSKLDEDEQRRLHHDIKEYLFFVIFF